MGAGRKSKHLGRMAGLLCGRAISRLPSQSAVQSTVNLRKQLNPDWHPTPRCCLQCRLDFSTRGIFSHHCIPQSSSHVYSSGYNGHTFLVCFPVIDQQQFADDLNIRYFLHAQDAEDLSRQAQETGLLCVFVCVRVFCFFFVAPAVHAEHLYAIASFLAVGEKSCKAECMQKEEVLVHSLTAVEHFVCQWGSKYLPTLPCLLALPT